MEHHATRESRQTPEAHLRSSSLCMAISFSVSLYAASCVMPCFMSSCCRRAKRFAKGGSKLLMLYGMRLSSGFRRYTSHIRRSSGQIMRGFLYSYVPDPVGTGVPALRARCFCIACAIRSFFFASPQVCSVAMSLPLGGGYLNNTGQVTHVQL